MILHTSLVGKFILLFDVEMDVQNEIFNSNHLNHFGFGCSISCNMPARHHDDVALGEAKVITNTGYLCNHPGSRNADGRRADTNRTYVQRSHANSFATNGYPDQYTGSANEHPATDCDDRFIL